MKAEASPPSIGRSLGTNFDAPTIPASVGSRSTAASISFVTTPAGTAPGHRIMAGALLVRVLARSRHDRPPDRAEDHPFRAGSRGALGSVDLGSGGLLNARGWGAGTEEVRGSNPLSSTSHS